jgi:hypothetical protein
MLGKTRPMSKSSMKPKRKYLINRNKGIRSKNEVDGVDTPVVLKHFESFS